MTQSKYKAECEALCGLGIRYLTKVYLPLKLEEMDWL
ncbi:DNA topoisomerase 6 subunit A [Orobanche hederae]